MRSTIKDVARKAKVSTATVSLAVHGNTRISSDTRKKVLKAIEDLDYHPSKSARDLVSKKTGNIGFILTEDHFLKSEPFYTKIFLGTEFEARKHPYYVLLATIPSNYQIPDPLPRFILENSVDGIIIAGKVPEALIINLQKYTIPVIFIDYYPAENSHHAVLIDNTEGGMKATQHLIDCGHNKIAFICGDIEHPSIHGRFQGYKMALEKAEIIFNPRLILSTEKATSRESGYHAASVLFKQNQDFSAVFACNDAMAIGAMQYFKEQGLKIPDDVSIIGFDDIDLDLIIEPALSTVHVPTVDMGSEALKVLREQLENKLINPKKILVPVELVVRNSTCRL